MKTRPIRITWMRSTRTCKVPESLSMYVSTDLHLHEIDELVCDTLREIQDESRGKYSDVHWGFNNDRRVEL